MIPQTMLPLGRQVLKGDGVVLIRTRIDPGDVDRNWAESHWYAICLPERIPFRGYTVIGRCDLRYGHNKQLYYGGNIGYRIYEPYRGNHMALKAAKTLIDHAKKQGFSYVIITCNPDNDPSRKTLERLCTERPGQLIDCVALPEDNDMYKNGDREKLIFFYPLKDNVPIPNLNSYPF